MGYLLEVQLLITMTKIQNSQRAAKSLNQMQKMDFEQDFAWGKSLQSTVWAGVVEKG